MDVPTNMAVDYFAAIEPHVFLDKTVKLVCEEYPAFWIIPLVVAFGYAFKQIVEFHAKRHPKKVTTHDRLDSLTFNTAVVPLLLQLNEQLKDSAMASVEVTDDDTPETIIEKYEQAKMAAVATTDLSALESSLVIIDSLSQVSLHKKKAKSYDRCYTTARWSLIAGLCTLLLNILIGLALFASFGILNTVELSRILVVCWIILAIVNVVITAVYLICQIRIDGMNYE